MKKFFIVPILTLFAIPCFAHAPKSLSYKYDPIVQALVLHIEHDTKNPDKHYVKTVRVKKDGIEVFKQLFERQYNSSKQNVVIVLPKQKDLLTLQVEAACSLYGALTKTIKVDPQANKASK
jgi:hypothetical protein